MCVACPLEGFLPTLPDLSFRLRTSEDRVEKLLKTLQSFKLIDSFDSKLRMHDWEHWQFQSDTSKERTKRYRERHKKRSGDVTRDVSASVSVSVSGSGSEKQENDNVLAFGEFLEAATAAGLPFSEKDMSRSQAEWQRLDGNLRFAAIHGLHVRKKSGEYDDPGFRPLPHNYLANRNWERPVRIRQTAQTKKEKFWDEVSQA